MAVASSVSRRLVLVVALTVLSQVGSAQAQDVATPSQVPAETSAPPSPSSAPSAQKAGQNQGGRRAAETPATQGVAEQHKLPPDSTTKQTLELPGRSLAFTATAGSIRLFDQKGEPQADIAYTSYQLDGTDPATRPVTFVFNGGPGAASAWLQLGNSGPWRLAINADSVTPSASPDLKPNAETWLDFTDLVYIDPVGTGYSRFVATGDEVRKRFFSVDGDVASVALVIRRWLEKHDRLLSPKYVVGESYGGIRGPKVVRNLQRDQGIGVRGLILISPVLDFREFTGSSMLQYVWSLPTYAAVARRAKGKAVTRADMTDVESYATSDFLIDLIKGQADVDANNRLSDKVAELTGIDQAVSRRLAGRFDVAEFRREFDRRNGRITGRYDASVMGPDPNPDSSFFSFSDPSGEGLAAPVSSTVVDLTTRKLNWRPDGSYQLGNNAVEREWNFGHGINPPQSVEDIRQIMAIDPKLKVLVGHGLFDLATPYFGSKVILDQMPAIGEAPRVKLVVYPGGHMFYSRDGSRQAFRGDAQAMMK